MSRTSSLEHEAEFGIREWSREELIQIGELMVNRGTLNKLPLVVAIFFNGQRIFQKGIDGSSADNDLWVQRKLNTVELTGHSSLALREKIDNLNIQESDLGFRTSDLAVCGGGFPLFNSAGLVGVLIVSGLPHLDDHDLIVDSLREYLKGKKQ